MKTCFFKSKYIKKELDENLLFLIFKLKYIKREVVENYLRLFLILYQTAGEAVNQTYNDCNRH